MDENKRPLIFAHRGASGYEHENSMASFRKAVEMGGDGLETDVFEIETGELIIFHDSSISLPGSSENIATAKLTTEMLQTIKLPNGEKIPLLKEFFEEFKDVKSKSGKPIVFSIDIQNTKAGASMAKMVVEFGLSERVVLCSPNPTIVFKKIRPDYPQVRLVASNSEHRISTEACAETGKLGGLNIYGYNFKYGNLTKEIYDIVKEIQAKVFMWDLHDDESLKKAIKEFKLDAVYSNYPDRAVKIFNE